MDDDVGWEELTTAGGDRRADPPQKSSPSSSFSFEEATDSGKIVFTIYGDKGSGKTVTAMTLPGTKAVLCFDKKAQVVHKHILNGDTNIKVYDATKYFVKTPELYLPSSETTYEYVFFLLDNIAKNPPDWIIIDGTEILHEVCEMLMRKRHDIRPYAGIENRNIWKERKQFMDSIFRKAIECCKKGLVYTTYTKDDQLISEGEITSSKKIPKWIDTVLYETDIVLFTEIKHEKGKARVYVRIDSSKMPMLKTGQLIDITDKTLASFMKGV